MTMDQGDSYLLDTNILMYAFDRRDVTKQLRAREVIALASASQRGVVTTQVLGEFFVNVTRKPVPPLTMVEASSAVATFTGSLAVLGVTQEAVHAAIESTLRHAISYWDALIWTTERLNGIATVLSEDLSRDQSIAGVRTLNPFAPDFDLALLA